MPRTSSRVLPMRSARKVHRNIAFVLLPPRAWGRSTPARNGHLCARYTIIIAPDSLVNALSAGEVRACRRHRSGNLFTLTAPRPGAIIRVQTMGETGSERQDPAPKGQGHGDARSAQHGGPRPETLRQPEPWFVVLLWRDPRRDVDTDAASPWGESCRCQDRGSHPASG